MLRPKSVTIEKVQVMCGVKRKKIIYIVTKSVWGGAQRYVFDLATNLPREQFEIAVAAGNNGPLFDKLHKAGIRTIAIPGLKRDINFLNEFVPLWYLLKIFIHERPDIIHLNSSKIGGLGAVAAFIYKLLTLNFKPLTIFTVHGWGFKEDRPWWQKTAIFSLSWLSSLFHNKIILINSADYEAAKRFIPQKKLSLIYNGIGPIDFLPREEVRAFFAKKIGKTITPDILVMGTNAELTPNKGLEYLLAALSKSNFNSHYLCSTSITSTIVTYLIGEGEDKKRLQKQVSLLGLKDRVFFLGFLPDAARYLKGFDIFVLPSLKEGLPYVIMEAMAAGIPVVATNVGGIPDLIRHGENGLLVSAKDSSGMAQTILDISKDEKLRSNFSKASLKIISTKFGLKHMVQKTISIYQNV